MTESSPLDSLARVRFPVTDEAHEKTLYEFSLSVFRHLQPYVCIMFSLYSSVADGNTHHTLRANILLQDICKGLPWSSYLGYGLLTLGCDKRWGTMCVQILILTVSICIEKHHCLLTILRDSVTESSPLDSLARVRFPVTDEAHEKTLYVISLSVFRHLQPYKC